MVEVETEILLLRLEAERIVSSKLKNLLNEYLPLNIVAITALPWNV